MGLSEGIWYCSQCGDGPIPDWKQHCDNCGYLRTGSSEKGPDVLPTPWDDGAAPFLPGPASPKPLQNIVIDHSPVPDVGKHSEEAQFPIHDLPAEHQEREESYQAIEHVAPIKPGSVAVEDDSGYASQSRMDDSISGRPYIEAYPLAVEPVE